MDEHGDRWEVTPDGLHAEKLDTERELEIKHTERMLKRIIKDRRPFG